MTRRRAMLLACVLAALLAPAAVAVPAAAQDGGAEGGEREGGIEGAIEAAVDEHGAVGAALAVLGGVVLLAVSTEKLIGYLTRAALGLRLSLFALAVVFTGFEFDDTVVALVFSGGGLEGAALGTALGTGLAIVGVTLAIAAIVEPFPVDLPDDYSVLLAVTPLVLVPFVLHGTLTFVHGAALVGVFVLLFGYIVVRELRRETPVFRGTALGEELRADGGAALPASVSPIPEDRLVGRVTASGWVWIALAVVALAGIVAASMLLEAGSEAVIEASGVDGTVFGATVLTAVLTLEDVLLTLEPVRRGVPEIGVGNVIGSVLFSVTGNVGVIMLVSDLTIDPSVLTYHLPAIVVMTTTAAYLLRSGELKRRHGLVLGGLYVAYWTGALVAFGGVPLSG